MAKNKDDFQGKEEFQDVILQVMKYAAFTAIDNPAKFPNAVEVVRDLMEVYSDEEFVSNVSISKTKAAIENIAGSTEAFKVSKYKFRELVRLFGRSGFIPAKIVKGELDEETILAVLHETGDLQELEKSGSFTISTSVATTVDKKKDKKA